MKVIIQIKYLSSGGRSQQSGSFPLRGRKPELIAVEWIKQVKRDLFFDELLEVIVDEKEDITEKVKNTNLLSE